MIWESEFSILWILPFLLYIFAAKKKGRKLAACGIFGVICFAASGVFHGVIGYILLFVSAFFFFVGFLIFSPLRASD